MHSVDLGRPIFNLKNIKIIKWWQKWLLKLLPTHLAISEGDFTGSTIYFKYWRGTVYIVGVEEL